MRTTALPTRLEVMKLARAVAFGSAFFKKPIVSVSPRTVFPFIRTRRNSESRINRRDFGKRKRFSIAKILVRAMWVVIVGQARRLPYLKVGNRSGLQVLAPPRTSKSLPQIASGKTSQNSAVDYGVADAAGEGTLIVVLVSVSVLFVVVGDGFTTVVLVSFFSCDGGFTVSVFCSQAAKSTAAPARMQMYFFIRL